MADLCTVADVKLARRGLSSALDGLITALIPPASAAVADYADRQFTLDGAPSTRTFLMHEAPREVLIDDLSATPSALSVVNQFGNTTSTLDVNTSVVYLPRNRKAGDPITRVRLRPGFWTYSYGYELVVTGTFGFPAVPEPVKRAAVATVTDWLRSSQGLTPQTPDPFEPGAPPSRGLPMEAIDLLRPYRRMDVG